jgi:hypothetical protein
VNNVHFHSFPQAALIVSPRRHRGTAARGCGIYALEMPATPDTQRFESLVDELSRLDGVEPPTPGRGFGSGALRFGGKIFAMCVDGELVVKLPAARVSALVADGAGVHFDANKGKPMKEWFRLASTSTLDWSDLAREALAFANR